MHLRREWNINSARGVGHRSVARQPRCSRIFEIFWADRILVAAAIVRADGGAFASDHSKSPG
jgi:hypothetical protein